MRFCEGINIRLGSGCTTGEVDVNADADVVELDLLTADDVRARLREHKERSPVTAPIEETNDENEGEDDDGESDANHVVCPCRPRVTLCGRYTQLEMNHGTWYASDSDICRDCVEVIDLGCPSCGCHWNECCRKCATRLERLGNALRRMWPWS